MDVVSYVIGYQGGLKKGSEQGVKLPELENPAGAAQIRAGYDAIDANGGKIEGGMPDAVITVGTPSIDSDGVLSAGISYTDGYVTGGGKVASTQVAVIKPNDYNSGVGDQVIPGGGWLVDDIKLQPKTVTPSETAIEVTPDDGYFGLSKVIVEAVAGGGGSGGSGGGAGVPFIMQQGVTKNVTQNPGTAQEMSLSIPHGCRILAAYQKMGVTMSGSYYQQITSLSALDLSKLVITENDSGVNNSCDTVKCTLTAAPGISGSYYTTYVFMVQYATDVMTVTSGGDGTMVGTLNRADKLGDDSVFNMPSKFMGLPPIMQIQKLNIAEGITKVPGHVCNGQTELTNVDLSGATAIGNNAFEECTALPSVELGNVTNIGSYAFQKCTKLETIQLNPNLTSLGTHAFEGCYNLKGTLVIPEAITTVPMYAFKETKFDKVVFPAGLTKIDMNAFSSCTWPTEFDFSACTSVPTLSSASYLGSTGKGQVLKIPSALFDTWKAKSGWSSWASQMVAV